MTLQQSAWLALALAPACSAVAQPSADELALRSLAATCAACHGTDGRPAPGSAIVGLGGRDRDDLLARLIGFRDGSRPGTVMPQLAKGYTPAQLSQLAGWFAAQAR
ncbi:cytochrome C [Rhizobacter sp. OV335]|jgi:cytochrome c553|uniref:c-type cytochrome n=1 Tax=Rhizobacter sp. OV335 TaxID=1500264 RepID=UPI000913776E|nr:cytochrome C [Rhizobacter sp. OV335]SHL99583.1 Cytochrome c553 [Rhizobacter sp. OV335]